jgi:hypothetical protein
MHCRRSEARFLVITGKVAILPEVVGKGNLLCTVASIFCYRTMLSVFLVSKSYLTPDPHCFHLTEEDHMVTTGILCYDSRINKGECVVNDGCSCYGNMIASRTETFISLG